MHVQPNGVHLVAGGFGQAVAGGGADVGLADDAQGALGDTATAAKEKLSGLFGKVKSMTSEQSTETASSNQ